MNNENFRNFSEPYFEALEKKFKKIIHYTNDTMNSIFNSIELNKKKKFKNYCRQERHTCIESHSSGVISIGAFLIIVITSSR